MAKLENYNGSVSLMAGITQKGGGDFAMVEANAVQTREDGTRLDAELKSLRDLDAVVLAEAQAYVDATISSLQDVYCTEADVDEKIDTAIANISAIPDSEIIALFSS